MTTYLAHHGIMGMKWGVRRFQNEDGSLTEAGEKRYAKVDASKRLQRKDTKDAQKQLNKQLKANSKAMNKLRENESNAERSMNRAKQLGNADEIARTQKAFDDARKKTETIMSQSLAINQKISAIQNGTLKAGRDFIVQRDYNIWAVPVPMPGGIGVIGSAKKDVTLIER